MDQGNCAEIVKSVRRASASHDRTDRDYKEDGKRTVRVPNEEIRIEFSKSVREVKSGEAVMRLREGRQLIQDTVRMNEAAVAALSLPDCAGIHRSSDPGTRPRRSRPADASALYP